MEYGLLVGLLAVGIMAAVGATGQSLASLFCAAAAQLDTVVNVVPTCEATLPVAGAYGAADTAGTTLNISALMLASSPISSGSGISVTSVTSPSALGNTVTLTGNKISITPSSGGTDTFQYTITDSYGRTSSNVVTISDGLPPAPIAANYTYPTTVTTGAAVQIQAATLLGLGCTSGCLAPDSVTGVLAKTANNYAITYANGSNGTISYTPTAPGSDSFTYTITDQYNQASAAATVSITVASAPALSASVPTLTITNGTASSACTALMVTNTGGQVATGLPTSASPLSFSGAYAGNFQNCTTSATPACTATLTATQSCYYGVQLTGITVNSANVGGNYTATAKVMVTGSLTPPTPALYGNVTGFPACQGTGAQAPPLATLCADGTYYIGQSNNANMYADGADDSSNSTWNRGCAAPNYCSYPVTGETSISDGRPSTIALAAITTGAPSYDPDAPYLAAQVCESKNISGAQGHKDWYLPALNELQAVTVAAELGVSAARTTFRGTLNTNDSVAAGFYWSASENSNGLGETAGMFAGSGDVELTGAWKSTSGSVRCVRRDN